MFTIAANFISGCMLGIEIISEDELFEDGIGTHIVIDVFIVRFLISYFKE